MECLQKLARVEFQPQTFTQFDGRDPDQQFNFIEAVLENAVATITTDRRIIETEILTEMAPRNNSNIPTGLRLVEVRIEFPFPFYIGQNNFLELFNSINIDPYVLHLIHQNSFGFHQFPKPSASKNDSEISSYYLSTLYYALAWSFNSKTREVRAVLMTRGENPSEFSDFGRLLESFLPVFEVCKCPSAFLSLAIATQLVHFLDKYTLLQLEDIRKTEMATDHGDMKPTGEMLSTKGITIHSKRMAKSLTALANTERHLEIAKAALVHASKTRHSQQGVTDALSVLDTQVLWNESTTKYLLQRARNQITILQGLLSHEDAFESKKLAVQSERLATKTMEDSSAMKTIAVMTMLFLPGTFFAALFALPLFQWTESKVIQKSFWIYWAFTIPATALVFVVWNILTSWTKFCNWCRKVMRMPNQYEAAKEA